MELWIQYSVRNSGRVELGTATEWAKRVAYSTVNAIKSALWSEPVFEDQDTIIFLFDTRKREYLIFQRINVDLPKSALAKIDNTVPRRRKWNQ